MKSFDEILADKQKKEDLATIASEREPVSLSQEAEDMLKKEGTVGGDPTKAPVVKKLVDNNHEAMK